MLKIRVSKKESVIIIEMVGLNNVFIWVIFMFFCIIFVDLMWNFLILVVFFLNVLMILILLMFFWILLFKVENVVCVWWNCVWSNVL